MVPCCPKQSGTFECGYYVMKYLQDIVRDLYILENNVGKVKGKAKPKE